MAHNENTRVKIPALLHLEGLGYKYLSLKNLKYDERTNILTDVFKESIKTINSDKKDINFDLILNDLSDLR